MADRKRDEECKKREEKRKKEQKRRQQRQLQEQRHSRLIRYFIDKRRKRRKKDCMLGLPFIIGFQGDPMRLFYCNDIPKYYELIPRTELYPHCYGPFERLKKYMKHFVIKMHGKVLIWKAT